MQFVERDLAREPLSEGEIREILHGRSASLLYARRGRRNKELGLDPEHLTDEDMIAYMAREPMLIRRPTLVIDGELVPQPSRAEIDELATRWLDRHATDGTGAR
ncbi:MAG: hypothetical protein M1335_06150 [Chloroflexi bacterium]|nr:hypothetical protein [Chloroflexota bacterium]